MNQSKILKKQAKIDEFFGSLKAWSIRKHRLLKKYLPVFNNKIGSWANKIYIIDGFAGPAKYEDGSEGSPLLIAHLTDEYKAKKVNLINVEYKNTHFISLCNETKKWVEGGIITNKQGKFGDLIPNIIEQIGSDPAFFFIDPYGPADVHFSALKKILERNCSATELIMNFNLNGLRRLADDIRSTNPDPKTIKSIEAIVNQVNNILGSDRWQPIFKEGKPSKEEEKWLLKYYMKKISSYGYSVVAYPIREALLNMPKYYLLYCTRHKDGVELMNRFIREEEDLILEEYYRKTSPLIWEQSIELEINRRQHELIDLVYDYLLKAGTTNITRGLIKQYFITERFGCFHEKDYNAIVKDLINTGVLQPKDGRKTINDSSLLIFNHKQK